MKETKPIHTLNARGNVMLEVTRDYFRLSPDVMHREIQGMRHQIETTLGAKEIQYDALKTALVPDRKRREIALFFDTTKIDDSWYGLPVFKRYMPLFGKKSNHSVLAGDYIDNGAGQKLLYEVLSDELKLARPVTCQHSSQFYVIYINNLTNSMFQHFSKALQDYSAYAGFADMTYGSRLKILLSTVLVNAFLKHRHIIIQGHEDDRSNDEDINMSGYPFEEYGYVCRSIQSSLEGVLLSYKIERPVIPGFEVDTEFSINAINPNPLPMDSFSIEVADDKLEYLKGEKSESLARAGLNEIGVTGLQMLIAEKLASSYIYNLVYLQEHDVTKFNVILEIPSANNMRPTRLLAALSYHPKSKTLELKTLF